MSTVSLEQPAIKVAIVTGAGTGIGAAVSRRLGALGWNVVLGGTARKQVA